MKEDPEYTVKVPKFFVHAAGTGQGFIIFLNMSKLGGTITSVGRYVKKYGVETEIVMADTQFSVYFDYILHRS